MVGACDKPSFLYTTYGMMAVCVSYYINYLRFDHIKLMKTIKYINKTRIKTLLLENTVRSHYFRRSV